MSRYQARRAVAGRVFLTVAAVVLGCVAGDDPAVKLRLHQAVEAEDLKQVRALLADGIDLNERDAEGRTALHLAAGLGLWPIEQDLLEAGADVGARSADGRTPLHVAVHGDNGVRTTLLLLTHGATPRVKDNQGRTPLHNDLNSRNTRILLGHGADPDARDDAGRTPLHVVAGFARGGAMIALIEGGADVSVIDDAGRTPLHYSVVHPSTRLASVLMAEGIDIDHQDKTGATALHITARDGVRRIIRQLVDAGANRSLLDNEGRTPVQVAIEAGNEINTKALRAYDPKPRGRHRKAPPR